VTPDPDPDPVAGGREPATGPGALEGVDPVAPGGAADPAARAAPAGPEVPASRALLGRVVVVTRAAGQGAGLRRRLEALGADVVEMPLIDFEALAPEPPDLSTYHWLVFTSANGVRFLSALDPERWPPPAGVRVAAVGPATAAASADAGAPADLVPARAVAEGLLDEIPGPGAPGERLLLVRAETGRDVLPDGLRARGFEVDVVAVYRTVPVAPERPVVDRLRAGEVDVVTFTSPSTVSQFHAAVPGAEGLLAGGPGAAAAVSIGPVTSARAGELGVAVAAEADPHTDDGLVTAVVTAAAARPAT